VHHVCKASVRPELDGEVDVSLDEVRSIMRIMIAGWLYELDAWLRQPDHNDDTALPVAHERRRDPRL